MLTQNKIDLRGAANKVGSYVLPTLVTTPNELRSLLFAGFLKWGANFVGSSTLSVRAKLPVGKNRQEARLRIYWNLFHPPMRQLNGPRRPIKQRHEEIQEKANFVGRWISFLESSPSNGFSLGLVSFSASLCSSLWNRQHRWLLAAIFVFVE